MGFFIVTGHSESGDNYGPVAIKNKPSDAQLKKLAFGWDGTPEEDGPGDYGSYVYLTVNEVDFE